jgi:hypothetical protein
MKTYIIYEIECNDENVEYNYVGHTSNFRVRKNRHKKNCNDQNGEQYNLKIYQFIRENGGWENWGMIPLEEFQCETTIQSRIREQHWMDIKQSKLNMLRAYTTTEQRKVQQKQQGKQYYFNNKEHLAEAGKQYRSDNIEAINIRRKQYRINNKEAIQERKKQIIVCECGMNTNSDHQSRHKKSPKHLELMSKLNL